MSDDRDFPDNPEHGPIYGVELIDTLPMDGGGMRQALPSRRDLDDLMECHRINGNQRIVAGFEVLTEHYHRALERIAQLTEAGDEMAKTLAALDYTGEGWECVRAWNKAAHPEASL